MTLVDQEQRQRLDELLGPPSEYQKTLTAIDAAVEAEGTFVAVVATFGGEPDRQGDVIHRGAFAASLKRWRASGNRIPVVWSHESKDPAMVIGSADPNLSRETAEGLVLVGKLNVFQSGVAAHVRDLLKAGDVSGWSFSFKVIRARPRKGGGHDLLELDLGEAGPCVTPANPATRTVSVKGEQPERREPERPPTHIELERRLREEGIVGEVVPADEFASAREREWMLNFLSECGRNGHDREPEDKAVAGRRKTQPAWSTPSNYSAASWEAACVVDYADCNAAWVGQSAKARFALPVRRPRGQPDLEALRRAEAQLPGLPLCGRGRREASKRLVAVFDEIGAEPHSRFLLAPAGKAATNPKATMPAPITIAEFEVA